VFGVNLGRMWRDRSDARLDGELLDLWSKASYNRE